MVDSTRTVSVNWVMWKHPVLSSHQLDVALFRYRIEERQLHKFSNKEITACLLLTSPLLLSVMEAVRNTEDLPSVSGNHAFPPEHGEVHGGKDGELPLWHWREIENPGHLSSVLSCASHMFSDLEQISLPHWTCLSLPVKRNCQPKCSRRFDPAWCWIQCINSLDLFTQS